LQAEQYYGPSRRKSTRVFINQKRNGRLFLKKQRVEMVMGSDYDTGIMKKAVEV